VGRRKKGRGSFGTLYPEDEERGTLVELNPFHKEFKKKLGNNWLWKRTKTFLNKKNLPTN